MSNFRRNLLKNGGGRMIEVTDRFESLRNARVPLDSKIGDKIITTSSGIWETLIIPRQNNLYADVSPYSSVGPYTGMIFYINDEDVIIGLDAKFPDPDNVDFKYNKYTRFALKFPEGSTKVYVTSTTANVNLAVNFRPRIYKKIF